VSEEKALTAYTNALEVTLGYAAYPEAVDYDDPILYAYADWGYRYVESLRLAYYYSGTDELEAVDALTGEPIRRAAEGGYAYDDIAGIPEEDMIAALARAGVGFAVSAFRPAEALTMRDAAKLLLSSAGYRAADWADEELRDEGVWMGFFARENWAPERELTQAEFIQMLLSASRYGYAAELEGVGYVTVARALGMIDDELPAGVCTRADAAALLYKFMSR